MNEVLDFLKKCSTYFIATTDGNQPRVRPFGTAIAFEDRIYILTSRTKDFSRQVAANPKVEICAMYQTEWLRIEAELVNDNRSEPKAQMLDEYPSLKKMYTVENPDTQALYLKNATATLYSFSGEPKVLKF